MAVRSQRFWKGSKKAVLGLAVLGVVGVGGLAGPASGAIFNSAGTGLYNAPATWGGATDPVTSGDASDTVTINNTHVVTVTTNTWMTGDALIIGTGGTLDLRNDAGTSFSLATLNISGNSAAITVSRATLGASLTHTVAGTMTLGGGGNLTISSSNFNTNAVYGLVLSGNGTVTGIQTFTVNNNGTGAGTLTLSGTVGGTGSLTKDGAGLMVLSNANNSFNGVAINGGVLRISADVAATGNSVLGSGAITLSGGVLEVLSPSLRTINRGLTVTTASTIRIGSGTNDSLNLNGVISGAGDLSLDAGGRTITLGSTNNSFTGQLSVTSNVSFASIGNVGGGNTSIGAPTTVTAGTIRLTGTLVYTGAGHSTDRVIDLAGTTTGATLTNNGAGALVFTSAFTATGSGNKTLTLAGTNTGANAIVSVPNGPTGATSLVKNDAGKWLLTGTSGYTGTTTVNRGTLLINGSISSSSAVTVGSTTNSEAATIGGTGTIGGSVTLNAIAATSRQARITAADIGTVGTLSIGTNLTFGHQSILYFDITSLASKDLINVGGTFNAASNTSNAFIRVSSGLTGGTYALVDYATAGSNLSLSRFVLQDLAGGAVDPSYSLALDGTNTVLNLVVAAAAGPANLTVTPASGSRSHGQTVTINANPDNGTYTIGSTAVSGYGWSQSGIGNASLSGTNNDLTGTVSHNITNSINGDNQGRFGFAISAAATNNGTYNYTLTNTVAGIVAPFGAIDAFGTTQKATILSGNTVAGYSVNGTRNTGLNQLGSIFTIQASEALTADTDLEMSIRRRVDGGANDEVTAGDANFARFQNSSGKLFSDVVNINGIDGKLYVLTISYNEADLGGHLEEALRLGWLDENANKWLMAVLGNTGGSYQDLGVSAWTTIGTLDAGDLGKFGVDTANNYVWAVLNHNSQFAVVPEPTSLALLGLGAAGLLARRRRK